MTRRYELQGFFLTKRGKRRKNGKAAFKVQSNDPHEIAVHMWRIQKESPKQFFVQVLDLGAGRAHMIPVVSYEELLRRAGSSTARNA